MVPNFSEGITDRTGGRTMLYLTCVMITSVDLACYRLSRAKDLDIWGLWYNEDKLSINQFD